VRESVYRDQLARVLEDARVKNAMLLEAQRQVQWRLSLAEVHLLSVLIVSCALAVSTDRVMCTCCQY
jgi:hypothetical protein